MPHTGHDLDQTHRQLAEAAADAGVLVLAGAVQGFERSPNVALDSAVQLLALLIEQPRVLYLQVSTLEPDWLEELTCGLDDVASDGEPHEQAQARQLRVELAQHLGEPLILEAALSLDGVLHHLQLAPPWYGQFFAACDQLGADPANRRGRQWEQEGKQAKERSRTLERWFAALPPRLLSDEAWLTCTSDPARKARVRELVAAELDQSLRDDPKMASRVVTAVAVARAGRDAVVAARTAALEDRLEDLGQLLARDPHFSAASTKADRSRIARGLLQANDPLAQTSALVGRLVEAATQAART